MRQRHNAVTRMQRVARAMNATVFALAAAGALASALRGWPEALYAQAPALPPQTGISSTAPEDEKNVATFRRISNKLICQCSCGMMVLSCNHINCSSATYIRRTIKERMSQGQSDEVIVASFVDQYGPRILPEPPRQGFALLAWVMPFVALGLGAFGAMYALTLMRRKPAPADVFTTEGTEGTENSIEASPELVEKYREQIERELKNP